MLVMNLIYANRPDAVARSFLEHYNKNAGQLYSFPIAKAKINEGTFAGWDGKERQFLRKGRWVYAEPPQITTTHIGTSTTQIRLINVIPELAKSKVDQG